MTKELWVNLPVKNIGKTKEFFTALGFTFNPVPGGGNENAACMVVGEKGVIVMFFLEAVLKNFISGELADTKKGVETILSFDASSREEVDEIARKAAAAGGTVFANPAEIDGWMYGCGFSDLDGHQWNMLYMDMAKLPK